MDEYSFLLPDYNYPFIYRNKMYSNINELCMNIDRKYNLDYYILLKMIGYYIRFSSSEMLFRLKSIYNINNLTCTKEFGEEELELVRTIYNMAELKVKDNNNEYEEHSLSQEGRDQLEYFSDKCTELSSKVGESIMTSLGISKFDNCYRERVVLGMWQMGTSLMVCNILRPRIVNGILTFNKKYPENTKDKISKIVDESMEENKRLLQIPIRNPTVQMSFNSLQILGCGTQIVYDYLDKEAVNIACIQTGASIISYTLIRKTIDNNNDNSGAKEFKHTININSLLSSITTDKCSAKLSEFGGLDILFASSVKTYKLHLTCDGKISTNSNLDSLPILYRTLSIFLNKLFTVHSASEIINNLVLSESP